MAPSIVEVVEVMSRSLEEQSQQTTPDVELEQTT